MKKVYFWLGILIVLFSGVLVSVSSRKAFAASGDYFSLIVLPDTQNYVLGTPDYSSILESQVSWILSNLQSQKIAFVMQEGDMTNNNIQAQWDKFAHAIKRMDGKVPYALTVGNHDQIGDSEYTNFNNNFPISIYRQYTYFGGTFKSDKLENAYYLFSAGGRDWVVLSLAYAPSDEILTWAGQIADQYASRHVIVLTHCYMYFDSNAGSPLDNTRFGQVANEVYSWMCASNNGEGIWNKFVKLHKNITFVFSGHTLGTGIGRRMDESIYGNQVYQILANYQMLSNGGDGYLRIVDIYPDDKIFKVKTYSPYRNLYKTDNDNQFQYTSVNSFGSIPTPTLKPSPTPTKKPSPTPTRTPTPIRTPTPTSNPSCICNPQGSCNSSCSFNAGFSGIDYTNPMKCNLDNSLFSTTPTSQQKTVWCQRPERTRGDADGLGAVNNSDYFYYIGAVNGGKIPATVNPDFNGDGEVGSSDRVIIIKSL